MELIQIIYGHYSTNRYTNLVFSLFFVVFMKKIVFQCHLKKCRFLPKTMFLCVLEYFKLGLNATEIQRQFRRKFPNVAPPSLHVIKDWYANSLAQGSVVDHRIPNVGRPESIAAKDTINEVRRYFNDNQSVRQAAEVLNISKSSVHRILQQHLSFKATFDGKNKAARMAFANTRLEKFKNNEIDPLKIWFSVQKTRM